MTRPFALLFLFSALTFTNVTTADSAEIKFPQSENAPTLLVEIADGPKSRETGLMYRKNLDENRGMFFIFEDSDIRSFWMKNMSIPIDIIFIDRHFIVRTIFRSVKPCRKEPCEMYTSMFKSRYVLETKSGFCKKFGVTEGERIEYAP
jgi:uncharacterized membrane protein (UPF0127 family)